MHLAIEMSLILSSSLWCQSPLVQLAVLSDMQTHYVEMKRDGVSIATDAMLPTISVEKGRKLPAVFFQTR